MKNIVIICDGTGQGPADDNNMAILAQCCLQDETQVVYYDPGVGTLGPVLTKLWDRISGRGLWENVLEAYSFLMNNHDPGDKIYCFGYSRGAATIRLLVDLVQKVGLLQPGSENLLPYLKEAVQTEDGSNVMSHYTRQDLVEFDYVGVEDTVFMYRGLKESDLLVVKNVKSFTHYIASKEERICFPLSRWLLMTERWTLWCGCEVYTGYDHGGIAYDPKALWEHLTCGLKLVEHWEDLHSQTLNRPIPKQSWWWKLCPKKKRVLPEK